MPTSRTPLLLFDNVFDSVVMFPDAVLSASASLSGTDVLNLGDYRRERSFWAAGTTAANHYVYSLLSANKSPDYVWIDRGHNLWGKSISVRTLNAATAVQGTAALTIPALDANGNYTPGGDPTSTVMAVTEEGALYSLFTALAPGVRVQFLVTSNWNPILTGLMVGNRMALNNFANKFDEDAAALKVNTRESDAGWVGSDRPYSYQTLDLSLATIGDSMYDSQIRVLKFWVWSKRQPCVIAMNYGLKPERAWLYQSDPKAFSFAKSRVKRSGSMSFRECGPRVI